MNFEEGNKLRMVFHFYLPKCWKDLEMVEFHLRWLSKYVDKFNEVIFVISVDDFDYPNELNEFRKRLMELGISNAITIKVVQNTRLYESKTLYDEIINKLDELDGITFFGHSKGIGNELYHQCDIEKLKLWVSGMYYLTLEQINDMLCKLYGVWGTTYGAFKSVLDNFDNKYHWIYSGTFYWINCKRLYDKIEREKIHVRSCSNRFFSELFLGDIFNLERDGNGIPVEAESYRTIYLYGCNNFYDDIEKYIEYELDSNELENFKTIHNEINIKEQ